jgi:hypothetical protein
VRRFIVKMQQPVLLSPKFGVNLAVAVKSHWYVQLTVWPVLCEQSP